MKQPIDLMIDLETWDTAPSAAIRAVGLVAFVRDTGWPRGQRLLDCRPCMDEQLAEGRTVSASTVQWHSNLEMQLARMLNRERGMKVISVEGIARRIAEFMQEEKMLEPDGPLREDLRIWSRGNFDMMILRHLLEARSIEPWWRYWQEHDVRTLDLITPKVEPVRPHDPLSDALAQAGQVGAAMRIARQAAEQEESEQNLEPPYMDANRCDCAMAT
jgi:hypothetical protein